MSGLSPLADKVRPGFPMPPAKPGLWRHRQTGQLVELVRAGPFFVEVDDGSVDFISGLPLSRLVWRPDFHDLFRPAGLLARAGAALRQALGRPPCSSA